jgi:hypothetical protein
MTQRTTDASSNNPSVLSTRLNSEQPNHVQERAPTPGALPASVPANATQNVPGTEQPRWIIAPRMILSHSQQSGGSGVNFLSTSPVQESFSSNQGSSLMAMNYPDKPSYEDLVEKNEPNTSSHSHKKPAQPLDSPVHKPDARVSGGDAIRPMPIRALSATNLSASNTMGHFSRPGDATRQLPDGQRGLFSADNTITGVRHRRPQRPHPRHPHRPPLRWSHTSLWLSQDELATVTLPPLRPSRLENIWESELKGDDRQEANIVMDDGTVHRRRMSRTSFLSFE